MAKTLIIYAATALHAALVEEVVTPAREGGQSVRLIGTEFFKRSEPETGAAGIVVVRSKGDDDVFNAIVDTYPELEVTSAKDGSVKLPKITIDPNPRGTSDDEVRELRAELIGLGGSIPAGADAAKLRDMIADQRTAAAQAQVDKLKQPHNATSPEKAVADAAADKAAADKAAAK